MKAIQSQIGDHLCLGMNLGNGFFQILSQHPTATQKLLMLPPHHSKWGMCILQTWAPAFNANCPSNLKVPTWITLRGIPGEFLVVAKEIAEGLGKLIGSD